MAQVGVFLIFTILLFWPVESRIERRQLQSHSKVGGSPSTSPRTNADGGGGGGGGGAGRRVDQSGGNSVTFSLSMVHFTNYQDHRSKQKEQQPRGLKEENHDSSVNGRRAKPATTTLGGSLYPDGQYFTQIKIGTPPQSFLVQVETAGDFLWINCEPCIQCNPDSPNCPFRNEDSSSNKAIRCYDNECVDLSADRYGQCGSCTIQELAENHQCLDPSAGTTCYYATYYEDESSSFGTFRKDLFHLPVMPDNKTRSINLPYGCGRFQTGLLLHDPYRASTVDGILGLSRASYALPSVLAGKGYKKVFAHCLGSGSGGGVLTFGEPKGLDGNEIQYTSFVAGESPLKYYVDFKDISIGRNRLGVINGSCANPGAVIDSGAAVTRVPAHAFDAIIEEIKRQAKISYNETFSREMNFPCFSGPLKKGVDDAQAVNEVLPTIGLHLGDIVLDILPSDYTLRWHPEDGVLRPCVFLMPDDQCVIGVSVMRNYLVVYDMESSGDANLGRMGWKRLNCESSQGNITEMAAIPAAPKSCH